MTFKIIEVKTDITVNMVSGLITAIPTAIGVIMLLTGIKVSCCISYKYNNLF